MRRASLVAAAWAIGLAAVAVPARADWLADANARIERDRKADLAVVVRDAAGNPVPGATVTLDQTASAFRWGTAVNSSYFVNTADVNNATYRQKLFTLFNQATLENDQKWVQWETPALRANAVSTNNALLDRGFTVRGHTMVWQRRQSLPADVVSALDNGDAATLRSRQLGHVAAIGGTRYNGRSLADWDVLNEQNANHLLTDVINPSAPKEQAPFLVEAFNAARAADPGARLYVNDYNILASSNNTDTSAQRSMYDTVAYLKAQGAPVGGLGFQGHHASPNARTSGANLVTILDRFSTLGLPMLVTEFDMTGTGWASEQQKADYMREFMTAVFSEKAVTGFSMWGFWDGK
ncbi:MAG: glycoside hydrolase family 10, partial [Phycisphaerales bacterium]|nr:glycoside hydrolase family 10 [Phycisphaerales bacterium]